MQIHLSDVSSIEGKCVHVTAEFEMDTITFQLGSFPVLKKESNLCDCEETPFPMLLFDTKPTASQAKGGFSTASSCDRIRILYRKGSEIGEGIRRQAQSEPVRLGSDSQRRHKTIPMQTGFE